MPTQPFTGTASYYKMLPKNGPTPLLLNAPHGQVGGQPKTLPFLNWGGGMHCQKHTHVD